MAARVSSTGSDEVSAGDVRVRLVDPHEHDRVAALTLASYEHDYELNAGYVAELGDVVARVGTAEVWVAADETGRLLGTVTTPRAGERLTALAVDGELDFRMLAVDPSARHRGVGRVLVEHVVQLARARGAHRVYLNSGPQMTGAHRLYERLGFVRLPERETYVLPNGQTLLAFGLDLADGPATNDTGG